MARIEDLNIDNKINVDNKGNMAIKGKAIKIDKESSFIDILLNLENRVAILESELIKLRSEK